MAVYTASARDLAGLTVAAEPELLVPRKAVFRYGGFYGGYRILQEVAMRPTKPNRQFATGAEPAESSLGGLRGAGISQEALSALIPAIAEAQRARAAWEAAGRPGLAAMEASAERAGDLAFAGMPGYKR